MPLAWCNEKVQNFGWVKRVDENKIAIVEDRKSEDHAREEELRVLIGWNRK